MNSLKLIEEEIKHLKDILESDYILDVPYLRDTEYQVWANDRLQTLQQIKLELEAWEVVKEELQIVFKGKIYYGEPLRRYELNVIGQNKIDTLNKGLEVEDE